MNNSMNFIVVGPRGDNAATKRCVFGEVVDGRVPNACYLSPRPFTGRIGRRVGKWAAKPWMPLFIKRLMIRPWDTELSKIESAMRTNEQNCVLFCPTTHPFETVPVSLLRSLRSKCPDCKLVYYLIDGVERTALINHCGVKQVTDYLKRFDCVGTYDFNDAEKYGYDYIESPVWSAPDKTVDVPVEYDVYFSGRDKRRENLLSDIRRKLDAEGVSSKLIVVGENGRDYNSTAVSLMNWRPYPEVVEESRKARCLLDIVAALNTGATIRYKEAVIYNKKLLTNFPDVARLPYYDSRWMKVFSDASDIDVDWLLRDEKVDYGYKGDFSAQVFLDKIEAALKESAAR